MIHFHYENSLEDLIAYRIFRHDHDKVLKKKRYMSNASLGVLIIILALFKRETYGMAAVLGLAVGFILWLVLDQGLKLTRIQKDAQRDYGTKKHHQYEAVFDDLGVKFLSEDSEVFHTYDYFESYTVHQDCLYLIGPGHQGALVSLAQVDRRPLLEWLAQRMRKFER